MTSLEGVFQGGLWRRYLEGDVFFILFNTRFPLDKDYLIANKTQKDSSWDKNLIKIQEILERLCLPKSELDANSFRQCLL